ncbi:MAG: transglycosylase domain-containing protein [Dorea sp.]|nr:transglycosylase domain-containing protein [Dorea sp.]
MNYGKRKAQEKQKKITSRSSMQGKRIGVRLFKAFLLCIIIVALAGVGCGFMYFKKIVDETPKISANDVKPKGFTTIVYADDGETEIERFVSSGANRISVSIDEVPKSLQYAFVAIEDERFYEHNGIDLQGIARAAFTALTNGGLTQGASTITQQLIKNNVFPNFVNEETVYDKVQRKIQEQVLAVQIEKELSKDEILENYLNTINLGQNCLGVQSAAKRYFNKDVSELTLSESAVIASITQNPSGNNPIDFPEVNDRRRKAVLRNMQEQGYINEEQCQEAIDDDVYARIQMFNKDSEKVSVYSYFVDALTEQVITDLQEQLGYTESQAYNAVYSGGLSIYSTQNLRIQRICDQEMNNDANYPYLKEWGLDYALTITRADGSQDNYGSHSIKQYVLKKYGDDQGLVYASKDAARAMVKEFKKSVKKKGDQNYDQVLNITPQPQAAMTIMDQSTGEIKALVGGRGKKTTSLSLNRAYRDSPRQPGSTFKIVSTYAPALNECGKTLATTYVDEPLKLKGGQNLVNASGTYGGQTSIRKAIQWSNNVVAVKCSNEITQELGIEYCENFGITSLVRSEEINGSIYTDLTETLALGGITKGVYNYEMCGAYATIANGGYYHTPTLYTKILDHDGNVLLEGSGESRQVIKQSTAAILTSAMEDVINAGTGGPCKLSGFSVAGKTGTTSNDVDTYFVGFTPYYTGAVWGGYDDNKECVYDTAFSSLLWKAVMVRIHENLMEKTFTMPSSVVKQAVCSKTGLLANTGCPTTMEYVALDNLPKKCTEHTYYYIPQPVAPVEEDTPEEDPVDTPVEDTPVEDTPTDVPIDTPVDPVVTE